MIICGFFRGASRYCADNFFYMRGAGCVRLVEFYFCPSEFAVDVFVGYGMRRVGG